MLTGNNPQITGDMARRTLALDIQPRSADPERDCYSIRPVELIREHRADFLRHAFTIMRAYRLAGMPSGGLPGVGSFDDWSKRVRDVVHWLTDFDLAEGFRQNKAEDPYRQDDASLLGALHAMYGTSAFASSDVCAVYSDVANPNPKTEALQAALDVVLGSRGVTAKQFGYWTRRVKGAHIGGFQLNVERDPGTNANRISVKRRSPGSREVPELFQPYC
jgi:putative DNA primase/helicase